MTTLNCHNNQNNDTTEQTSPQHERKPRFSSFRKSGALSKAVRSRLNLTKSAGSTSDKVSEKHNNCSESFHSLDTEKAELNENTALKIEISGHTDERGTPEYNQRLSERRSKAVIDYLVSKGLSRERFTIANFGEGKPIEAGSSPDAYSANRRVEFKVLEK